MTSSNNPNPELTPVENVDIDNLLSQVTEMTNRMENLMTSNKRGSKTSSQPPSSDNPVSKPIEKTPPSNPSESIQESELDQANDIKHLDELTQDKAQTVKEEWDQPGVDSSLEPTGHELDPNPDPSQEIVIDEKVDSLAEDEINHMLNRLGKKPSDFSDETAPTEEQPPAIMAFPSPIRKLLSLLYIINSPFIWIPASVRDALGYIAIGTLLFALGLWFFTGIFYKSS